jgi:hypothetical protein
MRDLIRRILPRGPRGDEPARATPTIEPWHVYQLMKIGITDAAKAEVPALPKDRSTWTDAQVAALMAGLDTAWRTGTAKIVPKLGPVWEIDAAVLPVASTIVEQWRGSHEDPTAIELLSYALGALLGESLRRSYGGHWTIEPRSQVPALEKDGVWAFPIDTARRALLLKEGDPGLVDYLERARSGFAGPTST